MNSRGLVVNNDTEMSAWSHRPPFCYRVLKYWWASLFFTVAVSDICLWLMNAAVSPARQPGLFTVNKSCSAGHVFKTHRGRGWATILPCEQFVTIFISLRSVPSLLLSSRAVWYAVFVFTFWMKHVLLLISPSLPLCCVCWAHLPGCDLSPRCGSQVIPRWGYLS